VARLSAALRQALDDRQVQQRLQAAGTFAAYESPEQMTQRMRLDDAKWGKVIRDTGISAE
jgi:tripartite-type tricarboxylate transporter receptor subunit TctC